MPHHKGPLTAKIAFIGEAFGEHEEKRNLPFVGPAGQLLDEVLAMNGIISLSCYITNVFTFRPKANNITPYVKFGRGGKLQHTSLEWDNALVRLKEELTECSANVLVPLGNTALYALTGMYGITKWRGSVIESSLLPGRKVIPTMHPAACLDRWSRSASEEEKSFWKYKYYLDFDIRKIKRHAEYPELPKNKYKFYLSPTFDEAMDYIKACGKNEYVGTDIETIYIKDTSRSELTHWALAQTPEEAMCISFFSSSKDNFDPRQEATLIREIGKLMANPNVAKIGQNYMFDSFFTLTRYGMETYNIHDTIIAQALILPDFPKDLGFLTALYTDFHYYKDAGKESLKQPTEELRFREYNCLDAVLVWEILATQRSILDTMELQWYYNHKRNLLQALLAMQHRGIKIDIDRITLIQKEGREKIATLTEEVNILVGRPINTDSPKQLKDYFYEELKIRPYRNRKTGRETVDGKSLIRLATTHNRPEAKKIVELRSIRTIQSTFCEMVLDHDDRLRCNFNPVGGGGSRLSSKKSIFRTGMNQQNQPPIIKPCMVADPGYMIFNMDLAQAENRVVAYLWNVLAMIGAFERGDDVHNTTAALIFQILVEEVSRIKGSTQIGGGKFSQRDIGKTANHAFNYGLGKNSFALNNEITIKEADFIRTQYFIVYPEILTGHESTKQELQDTRMLTDLIGRSRKFKGQWGDALFREAYAYKPQSTVGNIINIYGFEEVIKHYPVYSPLELLNNVHDSIVFQIPSATSTQRIARILLDLRNSLEVPLSINGRDFVIPVDISAGFNLGDFDKEKNIKGLHEFKSSNGISVDEMEVFIERVRKYA